MKKIILIGLIIFNSNFSVAQNLNLTPNGVESFIAEFKGTSQEDLYEKSLNWAKETYFSPNDVIKATIENEKIRLNGYSTPILWYKMFGQEYMYRIKHTITISVKEERIKFDYEIEGFYTTETYEKNAMVKEKLFKSNGTPNNGANYKNSVDRINNYLTQISKEYIDYVNGSNEDDW